MREALEEGVSEDQAQRRSSQDNAVRIKLHQYSEAQQQLRAKEACECTCLV